MSTETLILLMFIGFIVKHFICDFPIRVQTPWMFLNKGKYGHPAGIAHACIQGLASAPILWATQHLVAHPELAGPLIATEAFIHYHMDWFKIWLNTKKNYHPQTPQFWDLLGIDQLVHYLTYVGMIAVWVT